jgi:hypothetical protein
MLNYLNADERRKDDHHWHQRYGVTAMSLVRSLIDCLYNVTAILENPAEKGPAYRKSGVKRVLDDLNEDYEKYRGQEAWELFVAERRTGMALVMDQSDLTLDDVSHAPMWPTLSAYLRRKQPDGSLTENQRFLKTFTLSSWRQYSALSHGAFEAFIGPMAHLPIGAFYVNDFLTDEEEAKLDASYGFLLATHLGRAAIVLLCLLTELQVHCRFEGHNINERICRGWRVLMPLFEAKEFYDGRYAETMRASGIAHAE